MQKGGIGGAPSAVRVFKVVAIRGRHLGRRYLRSRNAVERIRISHSFEDCVAVPLQAAWSPERVEIQPANRPMIARPRAHLVLMHALHPGDGAEDRRYIPRAARSKILYRLVPLPVVVHRRYVGEWTGKEP